MYLLCIVVHCASVLSHTSDGWRHAFTYRWINVYKPLFNTYVRTYAYMSFCSHTRVFGVVSCMNLTQYSVSEYNYLVNEYSPLKLYFEKEKQTIKHAKKLLTFNIDLYSIMNIKYPIKTSFQTFIH